MRAPLDGVRVLDLTRILAGPLATQILSDLGADVIKVERPGRGDDTRAWGPPFIRDRMRQVTSDSTYFACCNRGKKSVTLDLSKPEGQRLIRELAKQSDVLVENFKVGDLGRHGLGYSDLIRVNPQLIYCSITGFGQTGPYRSRMGYDPVAQAMGALMSVTGEAERPPQRAGVAVVDVLTATYAVIAIQAALRHRDATGEGQHVDLALMDVQVSSMINIAQAYLCEGEVAQRNGGEHPSVVPSQSFRGADGYMMLAAANDFQFARLCEAVGLPELGADSRFKTNSDRVQHRVALTAILQAQFAQHPVRYWEAKLLEAGVPCGPVNDIGQVFDDPQVHHRGLSFEMEHASAGPLPLVASPLRLSASPVRYRLAPPLLGQHTVEVLQSRLGLSATEIAQLRMAGVI
ncbi:MAG TPA: CoA transferase [Burkholderiales bacterium]|nr:CoA transferase [Burkholderiales bacterium]